MGKIKNQHYVPQFYLRGFSSDGCNLFVFDKFKLKSFKTNIKNVACEKGFYDFPIDQSDIHGIDEQIIEKSLGDFENEFAGSLDHLLHQLGKKRRRRSILPVNQKKALALFISIQFLRTRELRSETEEMMEKLDTELLKRSLGKDAEDYSVEINQDWLPIFQAGLMFDPRLLEASVQILTNHIWFVGVNTTDQPFFTSDHPTVKRAHISDPLVSYSGLASKGIEIVFPLSPKYVLVLCERTAFREFEKLENKIVPMNSENVAYYNSLQINQCYRQILSSSENFDLVREIHKLNPDAFSPKRTRIIVGV